MTDEYNQPEYLKNQQYADSGNLNARIRLHQLYSTNDYDFYRWLFDRMLRDFPAEARLLEVGCGHGELWKRNADRIPPGWEIVLSDYSAGMVNEARESVTALGGEIAARFTFGEFSADAVPYPDDAFDGVIANMMLYHTPDEIAAIAELHRVLKPDGTLHAATNGHAHMGELDELAAILLPGLTAIKNSMQVERFRLENGAERLRTAFADVELLRYESDLKVTEVEPVVDYVLSMRGADRVATPELIAGLRELVAARIAAEGVFHISKHTGLFVARGEA